tara:strand:- start:12192 stop:12911 length:720 start_codon:yes stop_codon:yes gene_type:complete
MIKKKVCLILGGSGLIGNEVSKFFLKKDYFSIILDIKKPKKNTSSLFVKTDFTNEKKLNQSLKKIRRYKICTIINAVRINKNISSLNQELNYFDEIASYAKINLIVFINLYNLIKKNKTEFINISSTNSISISQQSIFYHVSKVASNQLMKSLAVKYGKYNLRFNNISLGIVDNNKKSDNRIFKKALRKALPLQKKVSLQDIANLAYYLSENNNTITGQDIILDSGMLLKDQFSILIDK